MALCMIFDLDDTLCDYQEAMANAKKKVSTLLQGVNVDPSSFWERYHQVEPALFRQFTEKKISIEEYRTRRYRDILLEFDINDIQLAQLMNKTYMNEANHNIRLFEDAIPLLEFLKKNGIICVVLTNGPSDGQRSKIKALGLKNYMNKFYISAEIGYSKPNVEAYEYVLNDLQLSASNAWMIGDSLENDVEGALKAGIRGILLDRTNKYSNYQGTKINSLLDLLIEEDLRGCQ